MVHLERGDHPETRVRERLDHYLVTWGWLSKFPGAFTKHIVRYKSDHNAIILRGASNPRSSRRGGGRNLRFEMGWLLDERCEVVVRNAWEEARGRPIQTRLAAVGRDLLVWSKEGYGNLLQQIEKVEKALHVA